MIILCTYLFMYMYLPTYIIGMCRPGMYYSIYVDRNTLSWPSCSPYRHLTLHTRECTVRTYVLTRFYRHTGNCRQKHLVPYRQATLYVRMCGPSVEGIQGNADRSTLSPIGRPHCTYVCVDQVLKAYREMQTESPCPL